MSTAILCGKRKEILTSASPLYSKSLRCSYSASPAIRFYPSDDKSDYDSAAAGSAALAHLVSIFPGIDKEVLKRQLRGDDLDSAIKSLNQLCLKSTADERTSNLPSQEEVNNAHNARKTKEELLEEKLKSVEEDLQQTKQQLKSCSQQLDTVSRENINLSQENINLNQENTCLKQSVISIQKGYDSVTQQLEESRKLEAHYHKKFRAEEVKNCALLLKQNNSSSNNNNNSMHSHHGY